MDVIQPTDSSEAGAGIILDKYDIVVLVEAVMSNPNGDPDYGNQPRTDPVTGTGIITNVCLKRKVRDYLAEVHGVALYHANGVVLREQRAQALNSAGVTFSVTEEADDTEEDALKPKKGKGGKTGRTAVSFDDLRRNQRVICGTYFDARAFGAVMDTGGARAANARGPISVSPALSIDPVRIIDSTITRNSVEAPEERSKERMMGSQQVVRYGLYKFDLTIHPFHAQRTGFSSADLALFREALVRMFDFDQASTRRLSLRGVYAFQHRSLDDKPCLGHAPRASLIERVVVTKREGVMEPLSFADYEVRVDASELPQGLQMQRWA